MTFSSTGNHTREIFSVQGSCGGAGGGSGEETGWLVTASWAWEAPSAAADSTKVEGPAATAWGVDAASAGCGCRAAGGEILRASMGSNDAFCAAHFAAKPFSGLLVLYSW